MARTKITRTFTESTVTFNRFTIDNGVVKMGDAAETITLSDVVTKERAIQFIPLNGADGVAILSIEPSESVYEMPVDVFRELAVKQGTKFDARAMVHRAMVAFHGELPEGEKEQLMMDTDNTLIPDTPVDPVAGTESEYAANDAEIEKSAAKAKKQNKKVEG